VNDDLILDGSSGGTGAPREQHPTGMEIGVCVDIINLGERVEDFPGTPKRLSPKVAFVFMTGKKNAQGELFQLSKEYTFTKSDKGSLRKMLGAWRGEEVTNKEVEAGLNLRQYLNKPVQLTISGKTAKNGNIYSNITGIAPLHPQLIPSVPQLPQYTRADFWEKRKQEYADAAAEFKRQQAVASTTTLAMRPPAAAVTNEQAVAGMIAAEAAQQADLPPF
jgi:hypothetical protein